MTDEDIQFFLTLKFNNIVDVVFAFQRAIQFPKIKVDAKIDDNLVMKGLKYWVEAGAPNILNIPKDKTEFFLKLKFGTVENAYNIWRNTMPHETADVFTPDELALLIDYIAVDTTS